MPNFARSSVLLFLVACTSSLSGVLAVNLESGERRAFPSEEDVPEGWAVCAPDGTCPPPGDCSELDERGCPLREDCVVVSDPSGGRDPAFLGCITPGECVPESCGPAPGLPAIVCEDGSAGGFTGRCLPLADGGCGWEILECPPTDCGPDECGPAPDCPAIICADGTIGGCTDRCYRQPDGTCGWEIRECPAPECTPDECGPALACPAIICADGTTGGCTDRCYRHPDGTCGWEVRTCPEPVCEPSDCGPPPGALPMCPDGSSAETICEVGPDGACGWQFRCGGDPCTAAECGPVPEVDFACPDGTAPTPVCDAAATGRCGWHFECPGGGTGGDGSRGCADGSGPMCERGLMCCSGIPYPLDGICHASCPAISDRDQKTAFETVDPESVLERVMSMPITEWSYRVDPGARHIGPMAQDFHERFGTGEDDRHIHPVDGVGVSLAAIQALNARLETLAARNEELATQNAELRSRLERLERAR